LRKTFSGRAICAQLLALVPPTARFRCNRSKPGALRPILCTLGNIANCFRSCPNIFGRAHQYIPEIRSNSRAYRPTVCVSSNIHTEISDETEVSGEIQSRQARLGQVCSCLPTAGPVGRQWAANGHSLTAAARAYSTVGAYAAVCCPSQPTLGLHMAQWRCVVNGVQRSATASWCRANGTIEQQRLRRLCKNNSRLHTEIRLPAEIVVRGVSRLRSERFGHRHVNCFAKACAPQTGLELYARGEGGGRKEQRSEVCNAEVLV